MVEDTHVAQCPVRRSQTAALDAHCTFDVHSTQRPTRASQKGPPGADAQFASSAHSTQIPAEERQANPAVAHAGSSVVQRSTHRCVVGSHRPSAPQSSSSRHSTQTCWARSQRGRAVVQSSSSVHATQSPVSRSQRRP